MLRIEHYRERYEPLDEDYETDLSFMKIYNTGEKVIVHKHEGHIQSRIVYYLMNIHIVPRTIYLTRHGESMMNLEGRIGGDSDLSERGWEYARALATFITSQDIQVYVISTFNSLCVRVTPSEASIVELCHTQAFFLFFSLFYFCSFFFPYPIKKIITKMGGDCLETRILK